MSSKQRDEDSPADQPAWVTAALRQPRLSQAWAELPPVTEWTPLLESKAFFSPFHFNGNEAFELPFTPRDYVYSPVVSVPVNPNAHGHYKRGVKKYRTMIARGETLPPITFLFDGRSGTWDVQDGGHRSMAAAQEGLTHQPAILAFPRTLLELAATILQAPETCEGQEKPNEGPDGP